MILGTGIDLMDSRRLVTLMEQHGDRFLEKYFTADERRVVESRRSNGLDLMALAKRFAAKEACAKALGTGFVQGIFMKDIAVGNDPLGKPVLTLTGGALQRLEAMTPQGFRPVLHLSLTDEPPYAQAQVIIEALPLL